MTTPFLNICKNGFFEEMIQSLDVNPFLINDCDLDGNNALFYVCQLNNEFMIKYLINNTKIDPNIQNRNKMYCITLLLINNNLPMVEFLISTRFIINNLFVKDLSNKIPLEYSSSYYSYLFDKYNFLQLPIDNSIKLYKSSDFEFLSLQDSGAYGTIFPANHKLEKKFYVIKKYDSSLLSVDIIKEIYFINKINEINPKIAVKLYGIILEDNFIALVLEKLYLNLEDLFKTYTNPIYFKETFKQLLIYINNLHSIGILHNDIKPNNFMINSENYIKIIDFGYSNFYGLGLSDTLYNGDDQYNLAINDNDTDDNIVFIVTKSNTIKKIIYTTTRKSYNNDVYSLANLFLNAFILACS